MKTGEKTEGKINFIYIIYIYAMYNLFFFLHVRLYIRRCGDEKKTARTEWTSKWVA